MGLILEGKSSGSRAVQGLQLLAVGRVGQGLDKRMVATVVLFRLWGGFKGLGSFDPSPQPPLCGLGSPQYDVLWSCFASCWRRMGKLCDFAAQLAARHL